jgi:hypothetical protein
MKTAPENRTRFLKVLADRKRETGPRVIAANRAGLYENGTGESHTLFESAGGLKARIRTARDCGKSLEPF